MEYRTYGNTNMKVSALGFGLMRLPTKNDQTDSGEILEAEAIGMIHEAIERGVNYFDTAYRYHAGQSEILAGRALAGGWRDKVNLVTKLLLWNVHGPDDFDTMLNDQLERLQTDHLDVYLLHGMSRKQLHDVVLPYGLIDKMIKAKEDGRIAHIGFSFHDEYDAFQEIMDTWDGWEVAQIQYNYAQPDFQAGVRGLRLAAARGMAVVAMEPLMGGRLSLVPGEYLKGHDERSATEWALDWLWNQPEVSVVLSGMHNMEQVDENITYAERSHAHMLAQPDLDFLSGLGKRLGDAGGIPCTKCSYCMPCPNGVNIPRNLQLYNDMLLYGHDIAKRDYQRMAVFAGPKAQASNCIACGECEDKCPQQIPISDWMAKIQKEFA